MRRLYAPARFRTALPTIALLGALFVFGCSEQAGPPTGPGGDVSAAFGEAGPPQDIGPALAAQKAHSGRLMAMDGVVGTAVGIGGDDEPSLVLYLVRADAAAGVPDELEGVPVRRVVTGWIVAIADPTTKARPAPLGFSVGHPNITAGTYGARVTDGTDVFMLSNNHVLAASNNASLGDPILQPGSYDGGTDPDDRIGTLHAYKTINFSGGDNLMDAAVAIPLNASDLSASTPADDGYGTPSSTVYPLDANGDGTVDAGVVGLAVQKYGRTTGHTHGSVAEVNAQISVCYELLLGILCSKSATFVDQIGISGNSGAFSGGGDSGSLIVSESGANPVALLFAGSDTRTFANRIDHVLTEFGVSVDDGSGGGGEGSPTASFTHSCSDADLICTFDASGSSDDGSIASYDWDFGDGNTGTGVTMSHTYGSGGTYTVTLTVTDDGGLTGTTTAEVAVGNQPPTADIAVTEDCADMSCTFDGTGSSDPDGSIVSYGWDFGDGNIATGPQVSHTYASEQTYTVTLTVTDNEDATGTTSTDVKAGNQPPDAEFIYLCSGLSCAWDGRYSSDPDGEIVGSHWDLGDGTTATDTMLPSHTYETGGTYNVVLTVTDDQGATDSMSDQVTVGTSSNEPPTADFTYSCTDLSCTFTDQSSDSDGIIADWSWDFGDGNTSTSQNPSHTYGAAGEYTVTLTVTDDVGATGTSSQTLTVTGPNSPPTASFTASCTDLSCSFDGSGSSDSDGSISSYDWNFGDEDTASGIGPTASHTYAAGGTYTVTLTVTDDDGASDSSSQGVGVSEPNSAPAADFTWTTTDLTVDFTDASTDSDGSVTGWSWDFGDRSGGSTAQNPTHTYADGGTYTVALTVTDDDGATGTSSQDVTVTAPPATGVHVGDLDGSQSSQGSTWTATVIVTVHDGSDAPEEGATVTVSYAGRDVSGTASCTTDANGTCSLTVPDIRKRTGSVTFQVTDVSDADGSYDAASNHDPDGDSDGTAITVNKP